jgi:hypothetical protein
MPRRNANATKGGCTKARKPWKRKPATERNPRKHGN